MATSTNSDTPVPSASRGPAKRATIRDIAREAEVSKSLVSLVFSNPSSVSPERTARVLAVAERLGYRPNLAARSLAGRSDFVGILTADLHNPLFAEIVDAARIELSAAGRVGLMMSATEPSSSRRIDDRLLTLLRDLRPSGLLLIGSVPDMSAIAELAGSMPTVVASAIPDELPGVSSVRSDDSHGMRAVIEHLRALGHRRIAHIGGHGGLVAEERARQYRRTMEEAGLAEFISIEPSDYSEDAGHAAADRLLSGVERPTAMVAVNDLAAVGALAALGAYGEQAGGAVSVTGWDNSFVAGLREISITSVDPHNAVIGAQAARLVLEMTAETPLRQVLIEPSLVVRSSTRVAE